MTTVFADTSFYVAVVNPRDQLHSTASPDKDWSLTDCIFFVVMRQLGLTDALTADRHFQQAGFKALLK